MQSQDALFARLREHNNASGGYLLNLMDAAYAPRDHPDRINLWSKTTVEELINEAEACMERVRPHPRADQRLADFNMEYHFYRQWTASPSLPQYMCQLRPQCLASTVGRQRLHPVFHR